MPALNIIAIHDTVRNSGCSSSRPSRMRPKRLNASHSAKTTKPVAARMKPQPPPRMTPLSMALDDRAQALGADDAPGDEDDGEARTDAEDDPVGAVLAVGRGFGRDVSGVGPGITGRGARR